jgi:TatD DNase family protein
MDCFDAHLHFAAPAPALAWAAVCCGTHPEQWPQVLAWAGALPEVRPSLGLHPWWLRRAPEDWPALLEESLAGSRAAVGECGLDAAMKEADPAAQEAALRIHLRLARELDRPLVLHAVRAWGALEALLAEAPLPRRIMIHAFGGSPETAKALN